MTKLNRIYLLGLIFTLCFLVSNCDEISVGNDYLSQPPTIDYTVDSVFSSQQNAQQLLWNTYATLPYGLSAYLNQEVIDRSEVLWRSGVAATLTDIASDGRRSLASRFWYPGNISASTVNGRREKFDFVGGEHWKAFYQGWTIIENIDKVPDMSQSLKDQYKGEARMIMAIHYVEMFRYIGGIEWVGKAFKPGDDFTNKRLTVEASVDSITTLLDKAMDELPLEPTNINKWDGRMTKTGAAGLKTRLLLFAASPLFNSDQPYMNGKAAEEKMVWTGGKDMSLWKRARDAAKNTIDLINQSSYYGMVEPQSRDSAAYRQAFRKGYFNRGSGETLISTRAFYKADQRVNALWAFYVTRNYAKYDGPTQTYVNMFPDKNGVTIKESNLYDPQHPYENRDPRFYETITSNISMWQGKRAQMWIGGNQRKTKGFGPAFAGYFMRKYVFDVDDALNKPLQWSYLRIPEIYLSYAEALNELNGGPTPKAYNAVNKVRNRVGLENIQKIMDDPTNQKEFRRLLIRERALEFGYENIRWFDMVRWKRKDIFQKELTGLNLYKKGDKQDDGSKCKKPFCYDYFSINKKYYDRVWRTNFSPKWYLDPIPSNEINKQYGLVQNPGWEVSGN